MFRPLTLVRSGWWVAVAGIAVAVTILWLALLGSTDGSRRAVGDGRNPTSYGFDLSTSMVPAGTIVAAGMPRDGMPVLDQPEMITAADVNRRNQEGRGKFLLDGDRVVGVALNGEARAYPVRLMRWHEVVNDQVGNRPILVTYNPLCDAAVVADREVGAEVLKFGVSGLVRNSNLLLYDRRTDPTTSSLWSQIDGRALTGTAGGDQLALTLRQASLTTWGLWSERYPETLVLAPLDRMKRVYKRDPYHSYFGSDVLRFPVDPLPPQSDLSLKARVLILTVKGREVVFSLDRIAAAAGSDCGKWETTVDGVPVVIHYDAVIGTALVDWPADLESHVATRQAFWFAWYSQHPDTPPPLPPVER